MAYTSLTLWIFSHNVPFPRPWPTPTSTKLLKISLPLSRHVTHPYILSLITSPPTMCTSNYHKYWREPHLSHQRQHQNPNLHRNHQIRICHILQGWKTLIPLHLNSISLSNHHQQFNKILHHFQGCPLNMNAYQSYLKGIFHTTIHKTPTESQTESICYINSGHQIGITRDLTHPTSLHKAS